MKNCEISAKFYLSLILFQAATYSYQITESECVFIILWPMNYYSSLKIIIIINTCIYNLHFTLNQQNIFLNISLIPDITSWLWTPYVTNFSCLRSIFGFIGSIGYKQTKRVFVQFYSTFDFAEINSVWNMSKARWII